MTGQAFDYFRQGGMWMYPLLFFSVVALTCIIERMIVFAKAKVAVNEFLYQGQFTL